MSASQSSQQKSAHPTVAQKSDSVACTDAHQVDHPQVSVIMCNYNYGRFIAEAIDSVLAQTFPFFELIVVDDGSTDESRDVISSYEDSRFRPILQENGGQAAAFNTGIAAARGELVCFLDSDDWWDTEKLATVVNWHQFLNGNYGLLQHGLDIWDYGNATPYKRMLPVGDCFGEMKASENIDFFMPTSALSMRRDVLMKVGDIPLGFRISADAYLMRTAVAFGPLYSIPDVLGFYRKHQNTVFRNSAFKHKEFITRTMMPALNQFYRSHGFDFELKYTSRRKRTYVKLMQWLSSIVR